MEGLVPGRYKIIGGGILVGVTGHKFKQFILLPLFLDEPDLRVCRSEEMFMVGDVVVIENGTVRCEGHRSEREEGDVVVEPALRLART